MKQNSLSAQRGSVTSIILLLIIIVIAGKLTLAIAPAQVGDYQLTKLLAAQLKEANANNETSTQYIERVNRQLNINAYYDTVAQDIFTFTNKKPGQLAIYKNYQETNNFFANVDIVNRFEGDIDGTSAE
ncbi:MULTISPECIES: DUF4845 domain-containing protein [Psychrobacter]|jgi:hypothetical protein|uniref:DUF4845 domain-containing protein n=1 Tax=Psychrobacter TaxID=497 RepID=UPI000EC85EFF|nr:MULTISPECIES: DUF4845 domain-containing protein [Psychrobacter]MCG3881440.1 DUF4845 domain-containing protein [Psychrobacter sp. Ps3]HAM60368.1 DUF4845 domain-containing protein [Psychrobacter sp.]|tara:strand:- start:14 stop:400 length:387 start_codon:yes stop_codon:yes gene_type:complete